ncbi:hypothetical protein CRUP_005299 [Coryphaenoides rupestris]|nr:hypothetical protein CRUP_005299 [Coryphaenoides rupestris]
MCWLPARQQPTLALPMAARLPPEEHRGPAGEPAEAGAAGGQDQEQDQGKKKKKNQKRRGPGGEGAVQRRLKSFEEEPTRCTVIVNLGIKAELRFHWLIGELSGAEVTTKANKKQRSS